MKQSSIADVLGGDGGVGGSVVGGLTHSSTPSCPMR